MLHEALADPSKTVRYYAALQSCGLGAEAGKPALPLLKSMVQTETDEDLVQRAKLCLLRLDPQALSSVPPSRRAVPRGPDGARPDAEGADHRTRASARSRSRCRWRWRRSCSRACPRRPSASCGRRATRDPEHFWEELMKLGPTKVIDVEGDEGEHIQIWIE